jgi:hypothetical protein
MPDCKTALQFLKTFKQEYHAFFTFVDNLMLVRPIDAVIYSSIANYVKKMSTWHDFCYMHCVPSVMEAAQNEKLVSGDMHYRIDGKLLECRLRGFRSFSR